MFLLGIPFLRYYRYCIAYSVLLFSSQEFELPGVACHHLKIARARLVVTKKNSFPRSLSPSRWSCSMQVESINFNFTADSLLLLPCKFWSSPSSTTTTTNPTVVLKASWRTISTESWTRNKGFAVVCEVTMRQLVPGVQKWWPKLSRAMVTVDSGLGEARWTGW